MVAPIASRAITPTPAPIAAWTPVDSPDVGGSPIFTLLVLLAGGYEYTALPKREVGSTLAEL